MRLKRNGVAVSKAFNDNNINASEDRDTVTGHAILYLQVGDKVNSMLTLV